MLCGGCDIDADLCRLTDGLVAHCPPGGPLEEASRAVLAGIDAQPARDDVALLVARTRVVREENTAGWQFPADPRVVAEVWGGERHPRAVRVGTGCARLHHRTRRQ